MAALDVKDLARRYNEALDTNGHLAVVAELFAPLYHGDALRATALPRPAAEQLISQFRTAFPNLRVTTEEPIAEGTRVATAWTMAGTQQGPFLGLPPTGKPVTISGVTVLRLDDRGQILDQETRWDALGLLRQLGTLAVQAPEAARSSGV